MVGPMSSRMDDLCAYTQEVDTAMGRSDSAIRALCPAVKSARPVTILWLQASRIERQQRTRW
jgi:hypothetical protein